MNSILDILNTDLDEDGDRPSRNAVFLSMAYIMSMRGTCRRARVGAIIVSQFNRIISSGYNGTLKGDKHCKELGCDINQKCQHAVHAELNAITFAAKEGISIKDCTLYSTTAPCYECAKIIIQSGIFRVIYFNEYITDINSGIELLKKHGVKCHCLK